MSNAEPIACESLDPVAAARSIYRDHEDFYAAEMSNSLRDVLSDRLAMLLSDESKCKDKTGRICAIDFDPWTSAQDGDVVDPMSFVLVSNGSIRATVRFSYHLSLGPPGDPQSVLIGMVRGSTSSCWRLDDLQMPSNRGSLKAKLERFYRAKSSSRPGVHKDP